MPGKSKSKKPVPKMSKPKETKKSHTWRFCPPGEHWVASHPMHVPPSKKNPSGSVVTRSGHCRNNPSGKDSIYADEITEIANQNFAGLDRSLSLNNLGFKRGNDFDFLIQGWTKYWNEVFNRMSS